MLCLRAHTRSLRSCLRQASLTRIDSYLSRSIQRNVSTQDSPEALLVTDVDQPPQVADQNVNNTRMSEPKADDLFYLKATYADGRPLKRIIQRSFPKASPVKLRDGLERLLSHTSHECQIREKELLGLIEESESKQDRRNSNMSFHPHSRRWYSSATGAALSRNILLNEEQYSTLQQEIDKIATGMDHHPHISMRKMNESCIVNIICTTHSPQGLSMRDVRLADAINDITSKFEGEFEKITRTDAVEYSGIARQLFRRNMFLASLRKSPTTDEVAVPKRNASTQKPTSGTPPSQPEHVLFHDHSELDRHIRTVLAADSNITKFRVARRNERSIDLSQDPETTSSSEQPATTSPESSASQIDTPAARVTKYGVGYRFPVRTIQTGENFTMHKYKKGEPSQAVAIENYLSGKKVRKAYEGEEPMTAADILRRSRTWKNGGERRGN